MAAPVVAEERRRGLLSVTRGGLGQENKRTKKTTMSCARSHLNVVGKGPQKEGLAAGALAQERAGLPSRAWTAEWQSGSVGVWLTKTIGIVLFTNNSTHSLTPELVAIQWLAATHAWSSHLRAPLHTAP